MKKDLKKEDEFKLLKLIARKGFNSVGVGMLDDIAKTIKGNVNNAFPNIPDASLLSQCGKYILLNFWENVGFNYNHVLEKFRPTFTLDEALEITKAHSESFRWHDSEKTKRAFFVRTIITKNEFLNHPELADYFFDFCKLNPELKKDNDSVLISTINGNNETEYLLKRAKNWSRSSFRSLSIAQVMNNITKFNWKKILCSNKTEIPSGLFTEDNLKAIISEFRWNHNVPLFTGRDFTAEQLDIMYETLFNNFSGVGFVTSYLISLITRQKNFKDMKIHKERDFRFIYSINKMLQHISNKTNSFSDCNFIRMGLLFGEFNGELISDDLRSGVERNAEENGNYSAEHLFSISSWELSKYNDNLAKNSFPSAYDLQIKTRVEQFIKWKKDFMARLEKVVEKAEKIETADPKFMNFNEDRIEYAREILRAYNREGNRL